MKGFTLLEVLIALAVVVTGFLGIVFLQTLSLRQVHAAYYRNIALAEAGGLLERFRVDPSAAGWAREFALAQRDIENVLPQGRFLYQCAVNTHACTVSVYWQDHGQQVVVLSTLI